MRQSYSYTLKSVFHVARKRQGKKLREERKLARAEESRKRGKTDVALEKEAAQKEKNLRFNGEWKVSIAIPSDVLYFTFDYSGDDLDCTVFGGPYKAATFKFSDGSSISDKVMVLSGKLKSKGNGPGNKLKLWINASDQLVAKFTNGRTGENACTIEGNPVVDNDWHGMY